MRNDIKQQAKKSTASAVSLNVVGDTEFEPVNAPRFSLL